MRYVVDLRHPLQAPCGGDDSGFGEYKKTSLIVEAVGMWESRRDFQGVWEGWKAGFMAFHAFHTLSFPWPAFSRGKYWMNGYTPTQCKCAALAMGRSSLVIERNEDPKAMSGDIGVRGAISNSSRFDLYCNGVHE